jgi:ABC-2 type transport system ATP-binding protein
MLTANADTEQILKAWRAVEGVREVSAEDGTITLLAEDSHRVLPPVFEAASANQVRIIGADIQEPNLESVFLRLTGRALRD